MKIPRLVDLTCREVTELVTDYMSDAMGTHDRARFEQHLHACTWCMTYLTQMRRTVAWTRELTPTREPRTEERLLELFRRWKADRA